VKVCTEMCETSGYGPPVMKVCTEMCVTSGYGPPVMCCEDEYGQAGHEQAVPGIRLGCVKRQGPEGVQPGQSRSCTDQCGQLRLSCGVWGGGGVGVTPLWLSLRLGYVLISAAGWCRWCFELVWCY
jgi:hypothetical protein